MLSSSFLYFIIIYNSFDTYSYTSLHFRYIDFTDVSSVNRLVKDLQQAFEDCLKENTWMSDLTKAKALEKLHAMHINVGYPDKWQDMEKFFDIRET